MGLVCVSCGEATCEAREDTAGPGVERAESEKRETVRYFVSVASRASRSMSLFVEFVVTTFQIPLSTRRGRGVQVEG